MDASVWALASKADNLAGPAAYFCHSTVVVFLANGGLDLIFSKMHKIVHLSFRDSTTGLGYINDPYHTKFPCGPLAAEVG